jgi:glycosyltransferase involved in cell wall biosynthesis
MSPSVLHVAQPSDGGVAAYVAAAAADQHGRGWPVSVACADPGPLADRLRAGGVRVLPWAASRDPGPGTLGETRRLAALVRELDPAVVHLHSSKAGLAGRLALRARRPTLFQPHGWSWLAATGPARGAALRWERHAARWATRIVCVSAGEREAGAAAGLSGAFTVVRNGADVSALASVRGDAARRAARARLGLSGSVVTCVGRLARQKGQDRLLAAWPAVRDRHPTASLRLVGAGPDRSALARLAGAGVAFVGDVDEVATELAATDLVVLPSRWEGLSLALVEALAAGRPVVTTAVAGNEIVPQDAGWVLRSPPDADALVSAELAAVLSSALDTPGRLTAMGAAAAALADAELDQTRTFADLAVLTESVLTG